MPDVMGTIRIKDMIAKTTLEDSDAFVVDNSTGTKHISAEYVYSSIAEKLKYYKYDFETVGLSTIEEAFNTLSSNWTTSSTDAIASFEQNSANMITNAQSTFDAFIEQANNELDVIDTRATQINVNTLSEATENLNQTVLTMLDEDVVATDITNIMNGTYANITTPYVTGSDIISDDVTQSDINSIIDGTYIVS